MSTAPIHPANPHHTRDGYLVWDMRYPLTNADGTPMTPRDAASLATIVTGPPELVRALSILANLAACTCGHPLNRNARDAAGIGLCEFCYEEAGLENELADDYIDLAEFDARLAQLRREHGRTDDANPAHVRAHPSQLDEFGDPA